MTRRNRLLPALITAAVLVVALAGVGIWYQFFRDDAPPPVSIGAAVAELEATAPSGTSAMPTLGSVSTTVPDATATSGTTDSVATATTEQAATTSDISGSWVVNADAGSFVGYRVVEELASIGTTEAVGRTSAVTGTVTIDDTTVSATTLEADLTSLKSDSDMRDNQLGRQALETNTYPTATFTLSEPIVLDTVPAEGETVSVVAHGDLTLHGVTRAVEIPLDVQRANGFLVIVGSLDIAFADYEIDPPSSQRVLSVEDHGLLELQLFLNLG